MFITVEMPEFQNRTRHVHLVTTPEEYDMAQAVAERQGLKVSEMIRAQIREAYARLFGSKVPAAKKKPKK